MLLKVGNLFSSTDDNLLVTTNSYVKKNGCLVMGRGAAAQASLIDPFLPYRAGQAILGGNYPLHNGRPVYGIIMFHRLGLFQVKYNWYESADLDLIKFSVDELNLLLKSGELVNQTVSMNFPGIGNGRLTKGQVLPIISSLPDAVTIYTYE